MKHQLVLAAVLLSCATSAFAQFTGRGNNNNFNNNQGNQGNQGQNQRNGRNGGGATLPLPEGVNRVVSIDAYNTLLVESEGDNGDTEKIYTPITIRHGYSGGYAALYGGTSIPTAQFVSPGTQGGFGGGGIGMGGGFGGGGMMGGMGGFGGGMMGGGMMGGGFGGGMMGGNQFGGGFGGNQFGGGGFGGNQFGTGFNGNFAMSQTSRVGANGQQTPLPNGPNGPILFR